MSWEVSSLCHNFTLPTGNQNSHISTAKKSYPVLSKEMTKYQLSNYVKQGPSWDPSSSSASQQIPHTLRNHKVRYRVHKIPPLELILIQMNPVHIKSYFFKVLFNIILPFTPRCSPCFITEILYLHSPSQYLVTRTNHEAHYTIFSSDPTPLPLLPPHRAQYRPTSRTLYPAILSLLFS
jgi:hypothetical protein